MQDASDLRKRLPSTVIILGIVSFLTDVSSEMIYPLVPIFMREVLRAPYIAIGLTEAFAEAAAALLKVVSGAISDRTRKRKPLALLGYSLSSFSKPLLVVSQSWIHIFAIRFADRLGKGIRAAPRDALIADTVTESNRGIAFGLHRAMDTFGAMVGPFAAYLILSNANNDINAANYRMIFALAAVPAILAVIVLARFITEKEHGSGEIARKQLFRFAELDRPYKAFLAVVGLFAIGNSSDVFLILRARNVGIPVEHVLLIYVAFNISAAVLAVPAGNLSDKIGRKPLIAAGYLIFAGVYAGFAYIENPLLAWPLFFAYGAFYACTDSVQRAYAADLAPSRSRATAIGAYHTVVGVSVLPAGIIAGLLWDRFGPSWPFIYGSTTALLSFVLLLLMNRKCKSLNDETAG